MTTPAKIEANRHNAQLSTGPVTRDGKAMASRNARRHGLLSKEVVLPDEDHEGFDSLVASLREELSPVGEAEFLLLERIAVCAWRLRRLGRIEASVFSYQILSGDAEKARLEVAGYDGPNLAGLCEDGDRERRDEALARAREAEGKRDAAQLGAAYIRDAEGPDAFAKLSRYEAALDRGLYRALHELQRLQAARAGQIVPAPAIIDVEVSSANE